MIKLAFYVLLLLIIFISGSGINISFKPFKIWFNDLPLGIGISLIIAGVIFIQVSGYRKGNLEGYKEAIQDVIEEVKKK